MELGQMICAKEYFVMGTSKNNANRSAVLKVY